MADPKNFLIRAGKYNPTRETDKRRSIDRNAENAALRDSTGLLFSPEFISRARSSSANLDKLSSNGSDEIIFPANTPPGTGKLKLTKFRTRPGLINQHVRRPNPSLLANHIASTQLIGYRYHHDGQERAGASRTAVQPWRAVIQNPRLLRTIETAMKKQSTANLKRHTYTINHLKTPNKDFIRSGASNSPSHEASRRNSGVAAARTVSSSAMAASPLGRPSRTSSTSNRDVAKLKRLREESLRMQNQAREMVATVRRSLQIWKRRGSGEGSRRLSSVVEEGPESQSAALASLTSPANRTTADTGMQSSFVTGAVTDERRAQLDAYKRMLERRKQDTDFAVDLFVKQGEVRKNAYRLTREGLGLRASVDA